MVSSAVAAEPEGDRGRRPQQQDVAATVGRRSDHNGGLVAEAQHLGQVGGLYQRQVRNHHEQRLSAAFDGPLAARLEAAVEAALMLVDCGHAQLLSQRLHFLVTAYDGVADHAFGLPDLSKNMAQHGQ